MYIHFHALVVVEFFPDNRLVPGGETRPRFVSSPVVLLGFRHLNVVIEPYNLRTGSKYIIILMEHQQH